MAVSGTLTSSVAATNSGTVTSEKSVACIHGTFTGYVSLQTAQIGTTNWVTIMNFDTAQVVPINTPDITMIFRYQSHILTGAANVYLGA